MELRRWARDERGLVIAWLVRLLLGLAVVGVILFDAGAIVVNFFSVDNSADEVAFAVAADSVAGAREPVPNLKCTRRSPAPVCRDVFAAAREKDVRIVSAHFDQEGAFHVEVRREAETLIVGRISAISDWATATASATADTN